jgi:myo-inosose-2 dehydratase
MFASELKLPGFSEALDRLALNVEAEARAALPTGNFTRVLDSRLFAGWLTLLDCLRRVPLNASAELSERDLPPAGDIHTILSQSRLATMTVKLGINPITWTNDDLPWLGGDTPLETCLAEARQAGYRGVEMGGKFPRTTDALRSVLAAHDLALVSGWYDGRILERDVDSEFAAALPHLTLLRDLGCRVVVYADTSRGRHDAIAAPISQRPRLTDAEWPAYGRKITALAERMADFGVAMAFHHHMGTIVETDAEIDQLMNDAGEAVGLLFDTGHCMFAGGDPESLLKRHLSRVAHVHCKTCGGRCWSERGPRT